MSEEKKNAVNKLVEIYDVLKEDAPDIERAKREVRKLARELDASGGRVCPDGNTIP